MRDGEEVTGILPGSEVTIVTSQGEYRARKVVLTLGPWAPKFLPKLGINLPLKVNLSLLMDKLDFLR